MLDANDTTFYKMSRMLMNNTLIYEDQLLEHVPIVRFTEYWGSLFPFNSTFRSHVCSVDAKCGYSNLRDTYLPHLPPLPFRICPLSQEQASTASKQTNAGIFGGGSSRSRAPEPLLRHLPHHRVLPPPIRRPRLPSSKPLPTPQEQRPTLTATM
ncbi:hypothetical protein QBC36DRAFT_287178 [Triangularia setosa]|uniref:Uncharacterized protein n=1 Tax=Triangularia setosa TaxID=2587417 RepID=A0AAN6WDI5_9PEZI|nr:hypothetical protein QBC36DRAFT_287178 [Podospora setosa]